MFMKYTVITGASSGLGYHFAYVAAKHNHNLILIARNLEQLKKIQKDIMHQYNIDVVCIKCDLIQQNERNAILKELEAYDIDVLINNAGKGFYGCFVEGSAFDILDMIDLNIKALVHLTHTLAKEMVKKKQGYILNVASVASFMPGPFMSVYYASKSFVLSFSLALQKELQGSGVFVTTLCPGPTKTSFATNANIHNHFLASKFQDDGYKVASYGFLAMLKRKKLCTYGWKNKIYVALGRILPIRFVTNMVYYLQKYR